MLRKRFEYIPGQHRPKLIRNGAIFLAIFAAALYYAYSSGNIPLIPEGGRIVTAEFATSANVSPGKTPVRVAGVDVGTVEKLERLPGARGVKVTMRITDDGVKLHGDAEAHIYWRTLLGFAFYIQLDPGASSSGLDGRTIPVSRTTTQTELDQVVTALTPPSREGIRTIFREFDKGFAGTGAGDSIDQLGPSMRNIGPGLNALRGTQTGDLSRTVKASSRLMGALARNEVELGGLVDGADTTLGVTAARRSDLGQVLSQGPATLSRTRATMVRLRTTLDRLDPVVEELRPGARVLDDATRALRPAVVALRPVLRDARPLLSDLRPALRSLGSASNSGVPLLSGIDPSLNRLTQTIIPGLEARGATKLRLYEAIGPVFATVSESAALFDAYGHTQRFQAVAGGAKSLGLLPCTPELATLSINCDDFQKVVLGLLGQSPTTKATP